MWPKYSSLKTGMMITNARLSYTQTHVKQNGSFYFKKNHLSEVTRCRCWIASQSTILAWVRQQCV
ncbi:hypothetical protein D8M09_01120 [Enterobacter sp. R1(2018)]|nr:hypothetical protein D8M09_01120 [Enterobacter sp. R1(2018)]